MKKLISILIILMVPISLCFGQQNCRGIVTIVHELKAANYVKNAKEITGLAIENAPRIDSQYVRYEELKKCASRQEITDLMGSDHNVITAYAWKAMLEIDARTAWQFLSEHSDSLSERKVSIFINYCQGTVENSLKDFMIYALYDKLLAKEITLSATEIVDFLIFKEERTKKMMFSRSKGF